MKSAETGKSWRGLSEEIIVGMTEWRQQNPKATFRAIEDEPDRRLSELRARMLSDLAIASASADWPKIAAQLRLQNILKHSQQHQAKLEAKATLAASLLAQALPVVEHSSAQSGVVPKQPEVPKKPSENPWRKFKFGKALYQHHIFRNLEPHPRQSVIFILQENRDCPKSPKERRAITRYGGRSSFLLPICGEHPQRSF